MLGTSLMRVVECHVLGGYIWGKSNACLAAQLKIWSFALRWVLMKSHICAAWYFNESSWSITIFILLGEIYGLRELERFS
jgi:hypothetical protein